MIYLYYNINFFIYWLFSSGKQRACECLVYLRRYNESTLSWMRSKYVTPLQGNIIARMEYLGHEKDAATTASAQKKLQREIDLLKKKQTELQAFDDEPLHYADMKISLDLDDGVKVNYGKFGDLLAQKKAIGKNKKRGKDMKKQQIVQILRQYKHEVAKEYGISKMGIFGSVARNDSNQASDIDVFVEMIKPDLFALAGIKNDLESKFKRSVDIVPYGKHTNDFLKKRIDKDALYV